VLLQAYAPCCLAAPGTGWLAGPGNAAPWLGRQAMAAWVLGGVLRGLPWQCPSHLVSPSSHHLGMREQYDAGTWAALPCMGCSACHSQAGVLSQAVHGPNPCLPLCRTGRGADGGLNDGAAAGCGNL
jgi:hypothetical protein